jgi:hypothetical protein
MEDKRRKTGVYLLSYAGFVLVRSWSHIDSLIAGRHGRSAQGILRGLALAFCPAVD